MSPMTLFVERPPEANEVVAGSPSAFVSFLSVQFAIPLTRGQAVQGQPVTLGPLRYPVTFRRKMMKPRARCPLLVLLRQTCNRLFRFDRGLVQHGQRSSAATRRAAISRRRVAIESGTWRSVRTGSAPRPVIFGKGRHFDDRAATRFRGGKGGPFGHQEGVSGDA